LHRIHRGDALDAAYVPDSFSSRSQFLGNAMGFVVGCVWPPSIAMGKQGQCNFFAA
jgi:hypothetical protein